MQQINIDIFFFIKSVKKHKKVFYAINIISTIAAFVIVFLLPVYYESKVVFYPYSPEASDPRGFFGEKLKFNVFSDIDQSEKFILMAKSKTVKVAVIKKFDLSKRYKIDTTKPDAEFKVLGEFTDNMKLKKEENGGIIISAFDQNRDTAALIADAIVSQIEILSQNNIREKNAKILEVLKSNYDKMDEYIKSLRAKSDESEAKKQAIGKELEFALQEFTSLKFKYEQTKALVGNDMKSILIIEPASATYKKARPARMIIIGSCMIIVFITSVLFFGAVEFLKHEPA
jgi:membrane-associated protease RseP (regulator of RpoE activity)